MTQIIFLIYLYSVGLIFGLCFKKWIPFKFIVYSGFLWGSIIYSVVLVIINVVGFILHPTSFFLILGAILLVPLLFILKILENGLKKDEWITIIFVLLNFTLLNILFTTFNFTLATLDSFTILRLGRAIAYDGFSQNVIESFSAWGVLIPIIQSASVFLKFDYLVSLQFSFALSFLAVFFYFCENTCFTLTHNKFFSIFISLITTIVLVCTPMFIIQSFFIQGNLSAAIYFFIAIICGWKSITESNKFWVIFFTLSLIGVNLSRSETFIYSVLLIGLLLLSNKIGFQTRLYTFLPVLILQTSWFIYMYFRLETGSIILNPQKILLIIMILLSVLVLILLSQLKILYIRIFPILEKFFLLPFFILLLIMVVIKPTHMGDSLFNFFSNLLITGNWGITYWLFTSFIFMKLFEKPLPFETFLMNIFGSSTLIIIGLVFFRNPYYMYWADSANRLMTLVFPIGLLLIAITISKWSGHFAISNDIEISHS